MVGGCDAVIVTSVTREVGRDASDVIANHNDSSQTLSVYGKPTWTGCDIATFTSHAEMIK